MNWRVQVKKKVAKNFLKLPKAVQQALEALAADIRESGPIRGDWPNYSKLSDGSHHCHLSYSYVAVWTVIDDKIRIVEVTYVGSRENAPYEKARAIETLLKETPTHKDTELVDIGEIFPHLNDPEKMPAITFRGIRAKTGLTQKEVAKRLGITQAEVSKIECGKRSIGKALSKRIEKEFKIDYRRFL